MDGSIIPHFKRSDYPGGIGVGVKKINHGFTPAHVGASWDLKLSGDAVRTERACPECGSRTYELQYPQTYVKVDLCDECGGVWLDRGEMKEIDVFRSYLKDSMVLEKD